MLISFGCLSITGVTQPFSGDGPQDRMSQFSSLCSGLCVCQLECCTLHSFRNRHVMRNTSDLLHSFAESPSSLVRFCCFSQVRGRWPMLQNQHWALTALWRAVQLEMFEESQRSMRWTVFGKLCWLSFNKHSMRWSLHFHVAKENTKTP